MNRVPVTSSNVKSVGYEQVLEVEFNGGVYRYSGVPHQTYVELMLAESKGIFINEQIKDVYPFEKVS